MLKNKKIKELEEEIDTLKSNIKLLKDETREFKEENRKQIEILKYGVKGETTLNVTSELITVQNHSVIEYKRFFTLYFYKNNTEYIFKNFLTNTTINMYFVIDSIYQMYESSGNMIYVVFRTTQSSRLNYLFNLDTMKFIEIGSKRFSEEIETKLVDKEMEK